MIKTRCAICDTFGNATLLYQARFPQGGVDSSVYAPRRKRDGVHYQMVKCKTCGLVRSDPIMGKTQLAKLYLKSVCDYTDKDENKPLRRTYGYYLSQWIKNYKVKKGSLLDIGCANGFFLEEALAQGFKKVSGVEPSRSAIQKAHPNVKSSILEGMFDEKTFPPEQFDAVTFFQTLDHVPDPNIFLQNCFKVLKKGGFIFAINHNIQSFPARLLKERCPIIDIGHAYLYDLHTMRLIFQKNGFSVLDVFRAKNTVSLNYFLQLLPLPFFFKSFLQTCSRWLNLDALTFPIYLGNLGIIARKPSSYEE